MPVWFRNADRRWPFLWEDASQPPARWHGPLEGPAQYLADTPDGAWAEFLRHEEITEPADLPGIRRHLWAIEVPSKDPDPQIPDLPGDVLQGGLDSYPECQREARRLRGDGATSLEAPSAALYDGCARGEFMRAGLIEADARDGRVRVLYGMRPDLRGWLCADQGQPSERLLPLVRPL
jgi:RES domain